ncbi:hypothetical protein G6F50_016691 [Rhizopus delemar]|uniref:Uncharacterized protein n=1 Tax=Rhizopus delemar TaxID=936053 RepID=A0A9P6XS54_9FUNG|nr:hypothetical protein G6F50_016691 [Rhizopus delemar]
MRIGKGAHPPCQTCGLISDEPIHPSGGNKHERQPFPTHRRNDRAASTPGAAQRAASGRSPTAQEGQRGTGGLRAERGPRPRRHRATPTARSSVGREGLARSDRRAPGKDPGGRQSRS